MDEQRENELIQKAMRKRKQLLADLITGAIAFVVGVIIFCLMFFLRGTTLQSACDATIVSGMILCASGLLVLLARLGAFDTFAFGFMQMGTSMFGKNPCKYDSLVEYKQARTEVRKTKSNYWIAFEIAGGIFITAFIILRIIYRVKFGF